MTTKDLLQELYGLLQDLNPNELDYQLENHTLFTFVESWKMEAERILKQLFDGEEKR